MLTHVNALAVMAKAPISGSVKTRLVPFLSAEEAAELARALLLDQLHHLSAIENAELYLAFSPNDAAHMMRQLAPAPFALFSQTDGDLGARMQNVFATLFARGHRNIVLIGADLPPLPLRYVTRAFAYLAGKKSSVHPPLTKHVLSKVEGGEKGGLARAQGRAVLGPSQDGGYYLIGLNCAAPALFAEMTWSHEQVLAETTRRSASLGMATLQLPQWLDIDRPDDLVLVQSALGSSLKKTAPHTWRFLRGLKSKSELVRFS
jgi:glycosyltransferase A (GT-A) superfamily protein (DUF2064 family)